MRLEALFFATFVCVKLCVKYQELLDIYFTNLHTQKYFLLLCNVGKFKSDLQVVSCDRELFGGGYNNPNCFIL